MAQCGSLSSRSTLNSTSFMDHEHGESHSVFLVSREGQTRESFWLTLLRLLPDSTCASTEHATILYVLTGLLQPAFIDRAGIDFGMNVDTLCAAGKQVRRENFTPKARSNLPKNIPDSAIAVTSSPEREGRRAEQSRLPEPGTRSARDKLSETTRK